MANWRKIIYAVCVAGILMLFATVCIRMNVPTQPDHYASVHPAATMLPLQGFAADSVFNVGDEKALDALPGVGEVIAGRIIDMREILKGYRLPEDLLLVKGIGEKTLDKIMDVLDEPLVLLDE